MSSKLVLYGDVGFVGLEIAEYALERGSEVTLVGEIDAHPNDDRPEALLRRGVKHHAMDATDGDALAEALDSSSTLVILGTKIGGIGRFHAIPADLLGENGHLYRNGFEAAVENDVERVLFRSSPMVYEQATEFPLEESRPDDLAPPESAYGYQKLTGERYCRAYYDQHELPYTVLRPFNVVGPGDYPGDEVGQAHVVPDLTMKIRDEKQYPLTLFGDGTQVRSFVDSRDVARAFYRAANLDAAENTVLNVGADEGTSIRELATLLWRRCDRSRPIEFDTEPSFEHDVEKRLPSISRARETLDWEPKYSTDDALGRYVDWYEDTIPDSG